jgi:hypothetical protein
LVNPVSSTMSCQIGSKICTARGFLVMWLTCWRPWKSFFCPNTHQVWPCLASQIRWDWCVQGYWLEGVSVPNSKAYLRF